MATLETRMLPFRQGDLTFDDFLALLPDGQKGDLLDGVLYMASPDNVACNRLNGWLLEILGVYVRELDLGEVYVSRVAFRITEKRGPEPDLAFVSKQHRKWEQKGFVAGPPDLAVEIVSPDSVHRDYILKREVYEQAGVPEYWILDLDERRATFLRLKKGVYEEFLPVDHRIQCEVVKGFWLDVRWLFDEPRPTPLTVINQLLAEAGS